MSVVCARTRSGGTFRTKKTKTPDKKAEKKEQ